MQLTALRAAGLDCFRSALTVATRSTAIDAAHKETTSVETAANANLGTFVAVISTRCSEEAGPSMVPTWCQNYPGLAKTTETTVTAFSCLSCRLVLVGLHLSTTLNQ